MRDLRIAQGMSADPGNVIKNWVRRGLIAKDAMSGAYVKVSVSGVN